MLFLLTGFVSALLFSQFVFAEVFIPSQEYVGYYDDERVYTVGGNVKNQNDFAVIPTISVTVIDGENTFTKTITHVTIPPRTDIPFKIKLHEITGNNPVLLEPKLKFVKTEKEPITITILYDKTLIKHDDGHVTGRIINNGNQTVFNPKILAIANGHEKMLDVVHNIEYIDKIEPGEIIEFSMYPDPSITDEVFYYSCFAPVDSTVIPISTKKNGGDFDFRYDSGAWYSAAKFNEEGTTLTMRGYNSYPLETYANFEFPQISGKEKFNVTLNDKPVKFIQSIDEMGFWHVAFTVGPTSQGVLKITGFEKGLPPVTSKIPQWIKTNANWWSTDQISDMEFLEGIDFLFEKGIVFVSSKEITVQSNWKLPPWIKITSLWWSEDKISDDDFLNMIENLVKRKIIII
ncbi:MAG: peptidase [Nitrosopumilales archaeon CG15_BIG_FIL_POST_REV_8_21_14_020_33_23]|nr:MAG: peptidase [Nitrosopumilales archaeon CG11_big_fil_rev_8_21_14_0_20_33_24]PIW35042.1 MAG: peptidase [Nitrosopumilales archaeon CG15_BIG_FIL_POST_REV_8_21_14_020_33_23]PIY90202.1 MAG: peptidase [Nitrosopumilales archaeon CG_4_10_14_0_8_um_filter_34_8]PJB97518.1 MAG: peptidase [Nitrosopumilales archaeon CG_4_9_14_0_8_um_filter_34_10]